MQETNNTTHTALWCLGNTSPLSAPGDTGYLGDRWEPPERWEVPREGVVDTFISPGFGQDTPLTTSGSKV